MIIVTGGAGFIGSALLWKLNSKGLTDIVVVDRLGTQQKWKNLRHKQVNRFIHRDRLFDWLEADQPKIEAIFHLGACSRTTEVDADFLMDNNVNYSIRLFQFATTKNIPFIYASSAATYGAEEANFSDDHPDIAQLLPINKYGFSKHFFDQWVLQQKQTPPFWAGLKFFNVYGPNEYHKESQASVAFHAFHQIRETGSIRLFKSHRAGYPDGEQKRDFVYVKDAVNIMYHLYATHHGQIASGIFNVGTGQAKTFTDLGRSLFVALKKPKVQIDWIDMPVNIRNQYQYFTQANLLKLREQAHYQEPFFSLEDGIRDYIEKYLLNQNPYL